MSSQVLAPGTTVAVSDDVVIVPGDTGTKALENSLLHPQRSSDLDTQGIEIPNLGTKASQAG